MPKRICAGMEAPLTLMEYVGEFPIGKQAASKEDMEKCVVHKSQWKSIVAWAKANGRDWANGTFIKEKDDTFKEGPYTLLFLMVNSNNGLVGLSRCYKGHKTRQQAVDCAWGGDDHSLPIDFSLLLQQFPEKTHPKEMEF